MDRTGPPNADFLRSGESFNGEESNSKLVVFLRVPLEGDSNILTASRMSSTMLPLSKSIIVGADGCAMADGPFAPRNRVECK